MKNSDRPWLALCPDPPVLDGTQAPPAAAADTWTVSMNEWFTPWRFAGLLFLLIFAAYPDVVLGTNTFFYRDYGVFGYPLAHYHREAFGRGELPFWNSLSNCGLPHLAQWNTMTLYPLSLCYLLLPMPWALGYFCLGHLFLGGTGMYCLAQRWTGNRFAATIAGLGYALNGLTLHALMWPNNIAALGWMPFVVLCAEQGVREGGRKLVLAVLVGAVQMLAGAPEIILFTWVLGAALCLTARETPLRARCARFALTGLLVALLAAAQLLPFIDLLVRSQRDQGYATNAWAMPAWGWANLLVPLFHCSPSVVGVYSQDAQQWTSSYYAGIGVTALALLGALRWRDRRSLILGAAALLSLTFALGSAGGIHTVVKKLFPFLGFVRFPIKFVVVMLFAAPLLAAMAVARWQAAPECASTRRRWVWICGLLIAFVAFIVTASRVHPVAGERWEVTAQSGLTRAALLGAVALGLLWMNRLSGVRGLCLRLGLVAVLGLDALTHMPRQNPTVPIDAVAADAIQREEKLTDGARVMLSARAKEFFDCAATANTSEFCLGNRRALVPNWNLVEGIPSAGGFYSLYTAPQNDLRSLWTSQTNVSPALANVLGVRWISSETNVFALQERPTALPVVTAGQRPVFADRDETLRALTFSSFDPAKEVLLTRAANGQIQATNFAQARVLSVRQGAGSIEAEVESDAPTLVTIAQTDYPGWSATVNGRPARLWRANHAFQAVEITAGQSLVRLAYRERTFGFGATFSLLALVACVTLWWRSAPRLAAGPSRTAPA
jgi:hypothetical protein